ncbi:aldehyde reductase II [Fusarium mexicanum]|uniref:Aldehyde reductase II n=1 Tax=Fusarium mexicanum TaxID=751941 RepID=A0A8H5J3Q8_9HYPO|nr:aldehyde reductase II [Fusarium mexicanum]
MHISNSAIPIGSIVVVVGANGYMAIETCEKLLQAGFSIRGTVRDVEKNQQWMHNLFDTKWPHMFELVHVPDFEVEGAFDEAFKGVKGVIYVSTPIILNSDPANVVEPVIKGTINSLEAAARAGVKRYVLSSSSKAVESTNYNHPHHITSIPDGQFGRALDPENTTSTFRMLKGAAEGEWDKVFGQVAYFTDVQDAARLLVAAVALPSLIRVISPKGEKLVKGEDQAVEGKDLSSADGVIKRADGILREIGQQGFASEEDILRDFLECL